MGRRRVSYVGGAGSLKEFVPEITSPVGELSIAVVVVVVVVGSGFTAVSPCGCVNLVRIKFTSVSTSALVDMAPTLARTTLEEWK